MNKVLFVLPNDSLSGAEQILKMIASNLDDSLIEVHFLTKKKTSQWDDLHNVKLTDSNTNSQYLGAVIYFFQLLFSKKETYDYIFTSHVFVTGLIGIFLKLRVLDKKHFIGRESTQIFRRFTGFKLKFYQTMYFLGYSKTDLIICQTDQMKDSFIKNLPKLARNKKVVSIQNPFQRNIIDKNNIIPYDSFIVTAGRLIPEKGFDILIRVFKDVLKKYPNHKLVILGEGNQRENLEHLIKELKLTENVILQGFVTNVQDYFNQADLCVVSSRIEGFPNVLLQMMAQNTKVVSTKCAGGIDQIQGVVLAEINNPESLLIAIQNCLESKENNREVFDSFLAENSIENYIKVIQELVTQK